MFKMVVWSWKLKVFNSSFVYGAFSRQLPTTNVKVCHFPTVIDAGSFKKISNVWRADLLESWHLKGASHTNKRSQHAYAGSSGFLLSHESWALLNTHNAFRTCRIWRAGFFFGAGWKRQTWKFNSENVELKVRGFVNFTCFAMTKDNKTTFVFVNRFFVYLGFVSNLHQFKLITFWKSRRTQNFGRDWKKRLFTKLCFLKDLCYWNENGFVNIYWQKQNFKSRN